MLSDLYLGAGIGYRAFYQTDFFQQAGAVDFLEIIPEHFWERNPTNHRLLELLAACCPIIPHGIGTSFGSVAGIEPNYIRRIAEIVEIVAAPYWSEHIAFTQAGGYDIGHLAPVPRTQAMLEVLCKNIDAARKQIKIPLILENITYEVHLPGNQWTDAEFLSLVVEKTGIGLLLDVTNLFTNAYNFESEPQQYIRQFLDSLPTDSVIQLHLAGGYQLNGRWVDSHSTPVPPPVWELTEQVLARFPVRGVIIERDAHLPPYQELTNEVKQARSLLDASRCPKPISAPIHGRSGA